MATFKQRENGWWQAVIRRKGYPIDSKTFEKKVDAEAWARKIETDIDRGVYVSSNEAERTTLGDIIKEFIRDFAPKHYRQREDKKEAWRFQCDRLNEVMGEYSLAAIDQKIIRSIATGVCPARVIEGKSESRLSGKSFTCSPKFSVSLRTNWV
jgi:hypothetical protein